MKNAKRSLGILLVALGLGAAGCGNDNVNACRSYVDAANQALVDCNRAPIYDADETCPETLLEGPDCSQYYECLGAGYTCNTADMTVTIDVADCSC